MTENESNRCSEKTPRKSADNGINRVYAHLNDHYRLLLEK